MLEGENNPSVVCRKPALVRLRVPESPGLKAHTYTTVGLSFTRVLGRGLRVMVN